MGVLPLVGPGNGPAQAPRGAACVTATDREVIRATCAGGTEGVGAAAVDTADPGRTVHGRRGGVVAQAPTVDVATRT
ncbi:hypothetical protein AB0N28_27970 [Streptomyces sp. NPDC051130]|uniref:hypothetical protein n=1 Tax=Streptomyces sp. NPDC051130 TaxID=3157223 RepID=UPI00343B08BA